MPPSLLIRPETTADIPAIRAVNSLAFPSEEEARLVDNLRTAGLLTLSLVAVANDKIIGHLAASPVTVRDESSAAESTPFSAIGLGPMAVIPGWQNRGVGSQLMTDCLNRLRAMNVPAVFLLGHKEYYPRFGFTLAIQHGVRSIYPDTDDLFFVLELTPGCLSAIHGTLRYSAPFDNL